MIAEVHGVRNFNRSQYKGIHPFFDEFPELLRAYGPQIAFWESRPLMLQQNVMGGVAYALEFIQGELEEMYEAVKNVKDGTGSQSEVIKEAADVGVVSFIVPALVGNIVSWNKVKDEVVGTVKEAREAAGLEPEEYARQIQNIIEDKNSRNHPPVIYRALPDEVSPEGVDRVYRQARSMFKPLREMWPGKVFPREMNLVLKFNGSAPEKFQEDGRYLSAIAVLGELEQIRQEVLSREGIVVKKR